MGDASALARAIFAGCSADVGPLIGIELGAGEPSLAAAQAPPENLLAVRPLDVDLGAHGPARLELASPLEDLARLALRTLGNDDSDTKRKLSDDDREAIGEILSVMGGSVEQGLGEQVHPGLRMRPLSWWRSDQPGDARFAAGALQVASGNLKVPGGQDGALLLRFSARARARPRPGALMVPRRAAAYPAADARRGEGTHAAQRGEAERRICTRRGEGTHAAQ